MKVIDYVEKIDEILSSYEDWMKGQDGEDCTKARVYLREIRKQCQIADVSDRLLICSRCNTEYRTESKESYVGCCIMPVEHRTSGICGGELIEQI